MKGKSCGGLAPSQPSTSTVEALDDAERHSDTPALTLSSAPDADTATDEDDGDKGAAIANEQRQVTCLMGGGKERRRAWRRRGNSGHSVARRR